jgi:hypothetical protein
MSRRDSPALPTAGAIYRFPQKKLNQINGGGGEHRCSED